MSIKDNLILIKKNGYRLPVNYNEMIEQMLDNIGSTDSELRDDLIYSTFSYWILNDLLSTEILRSLLNSVLDRKHVFYNIGDSDTNAVFTRSFSMLLIPLLLMANHKSSFLSYEEIKDVKNKLVFYIKHEKDFRGYVSDKGWAHAIAHTADAINVLATYSLSDQERLEILRAIRGVICNKEMVFSNLEDERLATATISLINKSSISRDILEEWINGFMDWEKTELWHIEYIIISNIRNFLSCLYFRLELNLEKELSKTLKDKIISMMSNY